MQQDVVTVGVDLAKNLFQIHAIGADGKVLVRRQLRRAEVLKFFSALPPCLVGMEACASAHHWGRELMALGHDVRLMPPAYVKRGKTDAADAEAICEAVTRPTMRFVAVKTPEQQAVLMLHKTRDLLVRQRTGLINALRAHLAEYSIIISSKGPGGLTALMKVLHETQERLPAHARSALPQSARSFVRSRARSTGSRTRSSPGTVLMLRAVGSPRYPASVQSRPRPSRRRAGPKHVPIWAAVRSVARPDAASAQLGRQGEAGHQQARRPLSASPSCRRCYGRDAHGAQGRGSAAMGSPAAHAQAGKDRHGRPRQQDSARCLGRDSAQGSLRGGCRVIAILAAS